MYFHKNFGCYVLSTDPPSNGRHYNEHFDIISPLPELPTVPMRQLHKNYVIRQHQEVHRCITLVSPMHRPIAASLLDEPLPLNFCAKVLTPVNIHKKVPTARLVDIADLHFLPTCHYVNSTSLLDEQIPFDATPTLIPHVINSTSFLLDEQVPFDTLIPHGKHQDPNPLTAGDLRDILEMPTTHRIGMSKELRRNMQTPISPVQSSKSCYTPKEHKFAFGIILVHIYTFIFSFALIFRQLRISAPSFLRHDGPKEDYTNETPVFKVRVKSKFKNVQKATRSTYMNPHITPTVLSWSLLPPDIHPVLPK